MASNQIPTNGGLFIGLVTKMIKAILNIGTSVPVTMVTAEEMQTELDVFEEANDGFNAARSARQTASDAYQAAMELIATWLQAARNALVPKLGNRWNTAWAQAGFINTSTAVPERAEDRLALVLSLASFFTKNPSYEAPSLEVTAAKATSLRATALGAQQTLTDKAMELKTAGNSWTAGYDPLAATARTLIKNLEGKLGKLDPRWLAFGLNMPGSIQTPGKPQNLTAQIDENGAIIVQCDPVALATRYRWRGMLLGAETEYSLVARSTDPMASIPGVLPGQTMQIIVQAVNGSLQGVASDAVVITVSRVATPTPAAAADTPLVSANGNGSSSNGHHSNEGLRTSR